LESPLNLITSLHVNPLQSKIIAFDNLAEDLIPEIVNGSGLWRQESESGVCKLQDLMECVEGVTFVKPQNFSESILPLNSDNHTDLVQKNQENFIKNKKKTTKKEKKAKNKRTEEVPIKNPKPINKREVEAYG